MDLRGLVLKALVVPQGASALLSVWIICRLRNRPFREQE